MTVSIQDYRIIPQAQSCNARLEDYFKEHKFPSRKIRRYLDDGNSFLVQEVSSKIVKGIMHYSFQEWESEILHRSCLKVDEIIIDQSDLSKKYDLSLFLLNNFIRFCNENGIQMVTTRVEETEVTVMEALEAEGFRFIECLLTFEKQDKPMANLAKRCNVIPYEEKYLYSLQEIASSSFVYSRFHADPMIDPKTAQFSRSQWITNSCHGRAEKVFVAKEDDEIVGFVACKKDLDDEDNRVGVIDLIAVHPKYQRRGIGSALVKATLEYYSNRRVKVVVGTQAKNIPSVNLYTKFGFKLVKSQVGFVRHLC